MVIEKKVTVPKQAVGWWFGTTDKKLGYGDGRRIIIGKTHSVDGVIIPCQYGLHLSKRIIDALDYASGVAESLFLTVIQLTSMPVPREHTYLAKLIFQRFYKPLPGGAL